MFKALFCLLVCNLWVSVAFAQEYHFKNIKVNEGLPPAIMYKTEEDSLGYIWMVTSRGILRYDGTHFKQYGAEDGLFENAFFHVSKIPGTNTLFFISNSFKLFMYRNGHFSCVSSDKEACWITYDEKRTPYILTRNGRVYTYDNGNLIPHSRSKYSRIYYYVAYTGNKGLLITGDSGATYIAGKGQPPDSLRGIPTDFFHINRVFALNNGRILVSGAKAIYEFDRKRIALRPLFLFKDNEMYTMERNKSSGNIMVGTDKGLWIFRNGILDEAHCKTYLPDKGIANIFKTSENVYVFLTFTDGIFLSTLNTLHYTKKGQQKAFNIRYIRDYGKDIYAFSENADIYTITGQDLRPVPTGGLIKKPNQVVSILPDSNGLTVSFRTEKDRCIKLVHNNIAAFTLKPRIAFLQAHIDDSLATVYNPVGLYYNRSKGVDVGKKHYDAIAFMAKYSFVNTVVHFLQLVDRKQQLYYYGKDKGYIIQSARDADSIVPVTLGSDVEFMLKVSDDLVVAGTQEKGLAWIKNGNVTFVDMSTGLSGNRCIRIRKIDNELWLMTENGLSRIIVSKENGIASITNFNANNELADGALNDFCVSGNMVCAASSNGIGIFSRHTRHTHNNTCVAVNKVRINNHDTILSTSYDLPYDQNNIAIEYRYPSLLSAGKVQYRYVLTRDNDTLANAITRDEQLQFFSLSSGKYNLSLMAMNADGVWNSWPLHLKFNIAPVFWKSWWFILLMICCVSGIATLIFVNKLKTTRKESLLKSRIIESELKALRLHMNPHFIFNTLYSLQRFVLKSEPFKANEYIGKFSRLIRQVTEYSDKQQISLQEELDFLNLYIELEQLRFENVFTSDIHLSPSMNTYDTFIPPLLIQPLVENAIKYGLSGKHDGVLNIRFHQEGDCLKVSIRDNGLGREQVRMEQELSGKETKSTGISYTEERLKLLLGNDNARPLIITDLYENNLPAGTQVELIIPVLA